MSMSEKSGGLKMNVDSSWPDPVTGWDFLEMPSKDFDNTKEYISSGIMEKSSSSVELAGVALVAENAFSSRGQLKRMDIWRSLRMKQFLEWNACPTL